jgi:uncharacterized protein (DUF1015 family)
VAKIAPFRGTHYNVGRFGKDVTRFVAPPYDVIDPRLERRMKQDRLNIAHITLGDEGDGYRTAAKRMKRWLEDKVLVADHDRAMYVYEQSFASPRGDPLVRSGLVCAVRLEEFSKGAVVPHERTMPKHRADRLALLKTVNGHTEQVFMLYEDPESTVGGEIRAWRKREEFVRFVDHEGVQHRLVKVSDPGSIDALSAAIEPMKLLIADGHHRYETALEYSRHLSGGSLSGSRGDQPHDHVLATLVSSDDPGLVLYPVHRLVRASASRLEALPTLLGDEFEVEKLQDADVTARAVEAAPEGAFGVWVPKAGLHMLARPRQGRLPEDALERLSVWQLQEKVLKGALGMSQQAIDNKTGLEYAKGSLVAEEQMAAGGFDACFFVKAPTVGQVMAVAESGRLMPQKSTYFYPKIWSGAVMSLF